MKNQKPSFANIIIIAAIIGITILTMTGYLSIIGWVFLSLYAVFPYLVSKIAKKKKYITTGIGSFVFMYLFFWIFTYTVVNTGTSQSVIPGI